MTLYGNGCARRYTPCCMVLIRMNNNHTLFSHIQVSVWNFVHVKCSVSIVLVQNLFKFLSSRLNLYSLRTTNCYRYNAVRDISVYHPYIIQLLCAFTYHPCTKKPITKRQYSTHFIAITVHWYIGQIWTTRIQGKVTYFHILGLWSACSSCHLCRSWHASVSDLVPL